MEIPAHLANQVRDGEVVLVLGAGASMGALSPSGKSAPNGAQLGSALSDKFLGGRLKSRTLAQISELAISESSLGEVQELVKTLLVDLEPTSAHMVLPTFRWAGIATTNYDLLIEKAYEKKKSNAVQKLVSFVKNEERFSAGRGEHSLMLLKLHGCLNNLVDETCPLILTTDQYVQHRERRSRLFDLLQEWAMERTIVFIGHSLQDPDLRQILLELAQVGVRARFFLVCPGADPMETRWWETKKITVLDGKFDDFISALENEIPSAFRGIKSSADTFEHPIGRRLNPGVELTKVTRQFLECDVDYVFNVNSSTEIDPASFYKGVNPGFSAIDQKLDVRRAIVDQVLEEVILRDEVEHSKKPELILIRAHAGAGKTVVLRRIAWEAAKDYDAIVLFAKAEGVLSAAAIDELGRATSSRVFLFVDTAADRVRELTSIFSQIGDAEIPLTVVIAERSNEWNIASETLGSFVSDEYELNYLTTKEIEGLLDLLEKHGSLGILGKMNRAERVKSLQERAGRQLLVALHESTLGKPFEEIIRDEFDSIVPYDAQRIYLTICSLYKLGVVVRAGIVSRLHGVGFQQFKEHFFAPLEHVVITSKDKATGDYHFTARHQYIAEMVCRHALKKQEDRFSNYKVIIEALNIDFDCDRVAFRKLTKAKNIQEQFSNHDLASAIYDSASSRVKDDGVLLHQRGIYELNRPNGSLQFASSLLVSAIEKRPFDSSIKHSIAELKLRMAESSRTDLEREKFFKDARKYCQSESTKRIENSPWHHTLVKLETARLKAAIQSSATDSLIEDLVGEAEKALSLGLQQFPNDSYLLSAEADLAALLSDSSRAMAALEKALKSNPRNAYAAIRLAASYSRAGDSQKSIEIYKKALGANANNQQLHYRYAKFLLLADNNDDEDTILHHLKRAFTPGDTNYDAQLLYGRQLFLKGLKNEAREVFKELESARVSPAVRDRLNYPVKAPLLGEVVRVESTFAIVNSDGVLGTILGARTAIGEEAWHTLQPKKKIQFGVAFSFRGPRVTTLINE